MFRISMRKRGNLIINTGTVIISLLILLVVLFVIKLAQLTKKKRLILHYLQGCNIVELGFG